EGDREQHLERCDRTSSALEHGTQLVGDLHPGRIDGDDVRELSTQPMARSSLSRDTPRSNGLLEGLREQLDGAGLLEPHLERPAPQPDLGQTLVPLARLLEPRTPG